MRPTLVILHLNELGSDLSCATFLSPPRVQYGDYFGTVSGDGVDMTSIEQLLEIDESWAVLCVEISFYGGTQGMNLFGVRRPEGNLWAHLSTIAAAEGSITADPLLSCTYDLPDHIDSNPPKPPATVTAATDLLVFGFKRFEMRLLPKGLRDLGGVQLLTADGPPILGER